MMQPTLTGPAELILRQLVEKLDGMPDTDVNRVGEDVFAIDTESSWSVVADDGTERPAEYDKDDVIAMIQGRLIDLFVLTGLATVEYVDHETFVPEPQSGPAFEAGARRLANTLYVHVYSEPLSEHDEQAGNYLADARELAIAYPHLLNAAERGIAAS